MAFTVGGSPFAVHRQSSSFAVDRTQWWFDSTAQSNRGFAGRVFPNEFFFFAVNREPRMVNR
jgi:hypothetical protein